MKERPILFSGEMVRAIREGRKTQTRRIVKPQPSQDAIDLYVGSIIAHDMECSETGGYLGFGFQDDEELWRCPYGQPGDRLWVREAFAIDKEDGFILYRSDNNDETKNWDQQRIESGLAKYNWRPSIHMPRQASRTTLEIINIRVERVQDISEKDAIAEGVEPILVPPDGGSMPYVQGFRALLESIYGPGSWGANPYVWVIEFKVVE